MLKRSAPFGAIFVLAFALLPVSDVSVDVTLAAIAAVLMAGLIFMSLALSWSKLPRWPALVPPFGSLVVVALLRQAEHGATSGYAILALVPVLWLALYGNRRELIAIIVAAVATFAVPIIVFGDPDYPLSEWRRTALFAALASLVGVVTQNLVFRARTRAAEAEQTARREREREAYLRTVMDTASEGIVAIDVGGHSTYVNPAAADMYGHSLNELLGHGMHEMVHHSHPDGTPYRAEECPISVTVQTGQPCVVSDEVFWRKDGSPFPVEYRVSAIGDDGRISGAVVTFTDISERLAVERMKNEFISVVSHELRTPLTAIRGSLGLLEGGVVGELPEDAAKMISIAISNADRLVRLINDILDVERIESRKAPMEMRPCELRELLGATRELLETAAAEAGLKLDVHPIAAPLVADPDRIIQVLVNLIGNAIKFSPPGGTIEVEGEQHDGRVVVRIRDQGPGIPADKQAEIFDRFAQADSADARAKGGSGLGLAIARAIVEQHGGRIWVQSVEGEGSTFAFELPLPRAGEAASPAPLLAQ